MKLKGFRSSRLYTENFINLFAATKLGSSVTVQTNLLHKRTVLIARKEKKKQKTTPENPQNNNKPPKKPEPKTLEK